jgi:hypothetical protein
MLRNLASLLSLSAVGAVLVVFAAGSITGASGQTPVTGDAAARPDSPAGYAQAVFDAWLQDDAPTIIDLSTSATAQRLLNTDPEPDAWAGSPACEGAAGSTYCTWTSASSQLGLRVANEAASQGGPHAVTEAAFTPRVDGIAIWPLTTQEEADNTQQSVDQGHSPWIVDPIAVASSYANAVNGWQDPVAEEIGPSIYRVTDTATGVALDLEIAQPARQGEGGIWAVIRTLMPVDPATTPEEPAPPPAAWDESAVWQPASVDFETWESICGASPALMDEVDGIDCGLKVMVQAGASPAAQDFLQQNGYFLESFHELGAIDYGRGSAPWINMGRPTQQLFLNGSLPVVSAPVEALDNWQQDPSYAGNVAADASASPWTEYGVLLGFQADSQAGVAQAIELTYPLKSCRACEAFGFAGVRYTFDSTGQLTGQTLLPFDQSQPE